MTPKNKPTSTLFIPQEMFNTLISALDYFVATQAQIGETFFSKHATRLKAKILNYGRAFKSEGENSVSIYFYGIESAMLIKLLIYYINLGENPSADYYALLAKSDCKKSENHHREKSQE